MIKQIHELISQLENGIGNGAKVSFENEGETLVCLIDWWDIDFHVLHRFFNTELDTNSFPDDTTIVNYLIRLAEYHYTKRADAV